MIIIREPFVINPRRLHSCGSIIGEHEKNVLIISELHHLKQWAGQKSTRLGVSE